jgi:hypothetical protein
VDVAVPLRGEEARATSLSLRRARRDSGVMLAPSCLAPSLHELHDSQWHLPCTVRLSIGLNIMKYGLGLLMGAWVMGAAASAAAETTGPEETTGPAEPLASVMIISPSDGAELGPSPLALDVLVEASGVAEYESGVYLLVDGVADDGVCEVDGACTFAVTLDAGEHELRAVIGDGDAIEVASSPIVTVNVGPVELPSDTETGPGQTSDQETGDQETGDQETGEQETDAQSHDDGAKGCAVDRSGPASAIVMMGLVLLGWSRRRTAA